MSMKPQAICKQLAGKALERIDSEKLTNVDLFRRSWRVEKGCPGKAGAMAWTG